jgi:hypothetical protein
VRSACRAAITHLLGGAPDVITVLGAGPKTRSVPAGTRGTLAPWGIDVPVTLGAPAGLTTVDDLPLSIAVGAWLLGAPPRPVTGQVINADLGKADCAAIGRELVAGPRRVGLLVMGDGAAVDRERPRSPAAAAFDTAVATALATGDAAALHAIDVPTAAGLECTGRAPWQALAGAAGPQRPEHARLHHHGAPHGVGYLVASWS